MSDMDRENMSEKDLLAQVVQELSAVCKDAVLLHAREYLSRKDRKPSLEIKCSDDECQAPCGQLCQFTYDQVEKLKVLRSRYGAKNYLDFLEDVFPDHDDIPEVLLDDNIVCINLDTLYYEYKFAIHELRGDKLEKQIVKVEMTDDEYVRLLALCIEDGHMNFNVLKYADKGLYSKLGLQIDGWVSYLPDDFSVMYPFLVTMDEVKHDADQVAKIHPELRGNVMIGYAY